MRKQSGFTLIELIIVIVILGILAAVALPRFINFTTGAREGVLAGVTGALNSVNTMIYAQATIQGAQNSGNTTIVVPGIDVDGNGTVDASDTVAIRFGYLRDNSVAEMQSLLQLDGNTGLSTQDALAVQSSGGVINIGYDFDGDNQVTDDDCHLIYTESTAISALPTITYVTTGAQGC